MSDTRQQAERKMCPHGCGGEERHCRCEVPIPMTLRRLQQIERAQYAAGRQAALREAAQIARDYHNPLCSEGMPVQGDQQPRCDCTDNGHGCATAEAIEQRASEEATR